MVDLYEIENGEKIGRDPRKMSSEDFKATGHPAMPLLKVMRAKCLDCCNNQPGEVRRCVSVDCPNWPYRMGTNPWLL